MNMFGGNVNGVDPTDRTRKSEDECFIQIVDGSIVEDVIHHQQRTEKKEQPEVNIRAAAGVEPARKITEKVRKGSKENENANASGKRKLETGAEKIALSSEQAKGDTKKMSTSAEKEGIPNVTKAGTRGNKNEAKIPYNRGEGHSASAEKIESEGVEVEKRRKLAGMQDSSDVPADGVAASHEPSSNAPSEATRAQSSRPVTPNESARATSRGTSLSEVLYKRCSLLLAHSSEYRAHSCFSS